MSNLPIVAPQFGQAFQSEAGLKALRMTAEMFCLSSFVKQSELKGGSQIALNNAMIICSMAQDFGVPVYSLLNSVFFVHGVPGFTAQFAISMFNRTGLFSRIQYEVTGQGEDMGCVASCVELATKVKLFSDRVTLRMAHQNRWSPIWDKIPGQMLRYRSAVFLIRSVAPEVLNGFYLVDELRDINAANGGRQDEPEVIVQPQEPQEPDIQGEFTRLCQERGASPDEVLSFAVARYGRGGNSVSKETVMKTLVNKPDAIGRAVKLLSEIKAKKLADEEERARAKEERNARLAREAKAIEETKFFDAAENKVEALESLIRDHNGSLVFEVSINSEEDGPYVGRIRWTAASLAGEEDGFIVSEKVYVRLDGGQERWETRRVPQWRVESLEALLEQIQSRGSYFRVVPSTEVE